MHIQIYTLHLTQLGDRYFNGTCRNLGRSNVFSCTRVNDIIYRLYIPFLHRIADKFIAIIGTAELLHGTQVPQIGTIKRQTQVPVFLPNQCTRDAVAERNSLIPTCRYPEKMQSMFLTHLLSACFIHQRQH